jgi:hypothetical protein
MTAYSLAPFQESLFHFADLRERQRTAGSIGPPLGDDYFLVPIE